MLLHLPVHHLVLPWHACSAQFGEKVLQDWLLIFRFTGAQIFFSVVSICVVILHLEFILPFSILLISAVRSFFVHFCCQSLIAFMLARVLGVGAGQKKNKNEKKWPCLLLSAASPRWGTRRVACTPFPSSRVLSA